MRSTKQNYNYVDWHTDFWSEFLNVGIMEGYQIKYQQSRQQDVKIQRQQPSDKCTLSFNKSCCIRRKKSDQSSWVKKIGGKAYKN